MANDANTNPTEKTRWTEEEWQDKMRSKQRAHMVESLAALRANIDELDTARDKHPDAQLGFEFMIRIFNLREAVEKIEEIVKRL